MVCVGLTGGIGCGKSTVAAMLREMGCLVIDADALAHQAIEPGGAAHDEVVREFGAAICDASGRIERAKLAAIVFADREKLERLNRIVHPRVIEAQERQLAEWQRTEQDGIAVVEAALLVEAGYDKQFDRLVVVSCRPEQQIERLRARGMSSEDARRRIAAQLPAKVKLRQATNEIDNSGAVGETRRQVERLLAELKELAGARGTSSRFKT